MCISPWFIIKRKKTKKNPPIVLFKCATGDTLHKKKLRTFVGDSNAGTREGPLINLWQCYTDAEIQLGDNQSKVQQLLLILLVFFFFLSASFAQ